MYDKTIIAALRNLIVKTATSRAKGKKQYVFQGRAFYKMLKDKTPYSQTDLNLALGATV
jgi:hypothetical protein